LYSIADACRFGKTLPAINTPRIIRISQKDDTIESSTAMTKHEGRMMKKRRHNHSPFNQPLRHPSLTNGNSPP